MDKALKEKTERMIQRIIEVPEGSMILKEGEVNLDMYKILSGHAEIYAAFISGRIIAFGTLGSCRKQSIYLICSHYIIIFLFPANRPPSGLCH